MKTKTRILAMLLTALMVIGILPLSLFAIDGAQNPMSLTASGERTLEEIREEFSKQNVNLMMYQTFDGWEGLTDGSYDFSAGAHNGDDNAEYTYSPGTLSISNTRQSYGIKTEEDENKALYLAPSTASGSNYVDFKIDSAHGFADTFVGQIGDASHDLFVSVDLKMNGANIAGAALFTIVYRNEAATWGQTRKLVTLSEVGGIYLGDSDFAPDNLVGFLSQDEYTRVALATDRGTNKFYLYINDVLVNPEGSELFTQSIVDTTNNSNTKNPNPYTAATIPVVAVRTYLCESAITEDLHKGMFMDNFLLGSRIAVTPKDTPTAQTGYSYDISNLNADLSEDEGNVRTLYISPSNSLMAGLAGSIGANGKDGTIRYVDEDGDYKADAIEWHKVSNITNSGQAYLQVENKDDSVFLTKGSNLHFSIDVKGGQDGQKGNYCEGKETEKLDRSFIFIRSRRYNGQDSYEIYINLTKDGYLLANSNSVDANGKWAGGGNCIGQLTKDKYTNITVDVVCNTVVGRAPVAMFYVDGELKYSYEMDLLYKGVEGYDELSYHPSLLRIYPVYDEMANLMDRDVRVKAFSIGSTQAYDGSRISVFENKPEGLSEVAGIERYYNGDSTFKTEDFTVGDEKYIVGFGGNIIGKESDGVEFAPYASYTDWNHTGTMLMSCPSAECFRATNSSKYPIASTMPDHYSYDSFTKSVTLKNSGSAVLYTSYKDVASVASTAGVKIDKHYNSDITLDLDVMLGQQVIGAEISQEPLFQAIAHNTLDPNTPSWANRADSKILYLDEEGWILSSDNKTKLVKLSDTEFTRISLVMHTTKLDAEKAADTDYTNDDIVTNATFDLYANGVFVANIPANSNAKYFKEFKYLQVTGGDASFYVKDVYLYESAKPQQFIDKDSKELTSDQSATPAKASDIKKGFVSENGVNRYYNELGLPVISGSFDLDGMKYTTDENGKVTGGEKIDGITSLYANSLSLDSDVKVLFYLDIDVDKADGATIEIGREIDYLEGTTVTMNLDELPTDTVDDKLYYIAYYGVPAKDMAANVKVRLVKADGTFGTEYSYSAQEYIDDVLAAKVEGDITEELKALVEALDVYGKNASAVLNKRPEDMVTVNDTIDWTKITDANGQRNDEVIELKQFSLELKSNIKIRVYFKINDQNAADNFVVKVNGVGANVSQVSNYIWCIEQVVTAEQLYDTFNFAVTFGDSTFELNLSALYYAEVMGTNEKINPETDAPVVSEAEKNLMKSIVLYADAAKAYKASK